ncbi:MAG TPA: cob(I)yrinic acid a,c-diamide adenosyltransferase [Acidimicrobiales bacterium]|nr:cob(I)yrinic acid a,c-diamide adenosyltransferase [Acidimicrobiales bacterium]
MVKIYTRKGDDGTTGLLYGGPRVAKNSPVIEANGVVDEAQAVIGLARAETTPGGDLDSLLVALERDLWVLMSEVATAPANRRKLIPGTSLVTAEMVSALETRIDELNERFDMPSEFVVPGQNRVAALLDVARTVVRRGERLVVGAMADVDSQVGPYLNRLSDLLWTLARWQEGEHLLSRPAGRPRSMKGGAPTMPENSSAVKKNRAVRKSRAAETAKKKKES